MYRDDRLVVRARLDAAIQARAGVVRELRERLEAIAVLNEQIERRGQEPLAVAAVDEGAPAPADLDALSLAEQLKLCDAVERDAERLRGEIESLGVSITLLNDRARGIETQKHERLGSPPRRVPIRYVLAEWATLPGMASSAMAAFAMTAPATTALPLSGVCLVALLLGALRFFGVEIRVLPFVIVCVASLVPVGAAAAWITSVPFARAHPYESVAGAALLVLAINGVVAAMRARFLSRCQVARVEVVSTESGWGSYTNWNLPDSSGWDVTYDSHSGSSTTTRLRYVTERGEERTRTLRGCPYDDGVLLYDPAAPGRSFVVHELGCAPRPDHRGEWTGSLSIGRWLRVLLWSGATVYLIAEIAQRARESL